MIYRRLNYPCFLRGLSWTLEMVFNKLIVSVVISSRVVFYESLICPPYKVLWDITVSSRFYYDETWYLLHNIHLKRQKCLTLKLVSGKTKTRISLSSILDLSSMYGSLIEHTSFAEKKKIKLNKNIYFRYAHSRVKGKI